MNRLKKLMSVLLVLAITLSMTASLAGCTGGSDDNNTETTAGQGSADNGTYNVLVQSAAGMPMEGIDVYIFADSTLGDMKGAVATDASGKASVTLPKSDKYAITLSGVPKGYKTETYYSFTGNTAVITLTSGLISGNLPSTLALGDIMYDLSTVTSDGDTISLSQMLKEKEVVVLNFWYDGCSACELEFPYMEEAYKLYSDKVGILAVSPFDENLSIATYKAQRGLTFPMAKCPASWADVFGVSGYPTTVIIDRFGRICLVEKGALVSLRYWTSLFDHFTGDDYKQKLVNTVDDLLTQVKPTYEMDSSENIGALINKGDIQVTYRPETGDGAEYSWPFIADSKNGLNCIKASNQQIDESYAIIYADVTLKKGQALGFDYLISSELGADILYVIVDGENIFRISGVDAVENWKSCYPLVATEDGTYEVALCYMKDGDTNEGEDTVYIRDMRVIEAKDIDTPTYLPKEAATTEDGFEYQYANIVFNTKDGYYHVGSANGPLLLADLMGYTQFNEEDSLFNIAYDGKIVIGGVNYYEKLETYFNYASNSTLNGFCTVNAELALLLQDVAAAIGFNDQDPNEWLKLCQYYEVYGTTKQLEDPISGLAPFSAPTAKEGKNVSTNYFYYDRIIMPRGLLMKFVPTKSGVYRITSRQNSQDGVQGWIFNENREVLLTYELDERMFGDDKNVSMLYYMEKGKAYYIDIAFWDVYETGYIYFDIEYVASEYDVFRLCSPGYFTYDTNATGDAMYYIIAGGIKAVLKNDGYYYEDLGKDANGKQLYGSKIYADFSGITALFSSPITSVPAYNADGTVKKDANGNVVMVPGMIELGGFDFTKSEDDLYILAVMKKYNNDIEQTKEYLKKLWGEDYDEYYKLYQLDDVFAGRYHGKGQDLTNEIKTYANKMLNESKNPERQGCVAVDERLAQILQLLMDKYTFEGVENSWLKLCYYYDHLGPNA